MANRFLDTNILLRYLTKDDQMKAEAALALLMRVEQGLESVDTSPMVIFETVFTLQHRYTMPRDLIREAITDLISLRSLRLPGKQLFREALNLFATTRLSFVDAYNVAYMKLRGLSEIYSWDMDFDHVSGITRVEPQA